MKRNLRLCGDRVAVERVDLPGKIIPAFGHHSTELDRREGIIRAVGSGKLYRKSGKRIPLHDLKVGQRVLFSKWAGSEMRIHGKDVIVMQMTDVLAVVTKETADETDIVYLCGTSKDPMVRRRQMRALEKASRRSA